jgi:sepiapterin reductase
MAAQIILITGASRGLGAAAARAAAALGANVLLSARSKADLDSVAQEIRQDGGTALVVPADVSREEDCRKIIKAGLAQYGRINALINNAGLLEPVARLADADTAAWEQNVAVNLFGPVTLTRLALPHLRQSRGRVINVSSGAAVSPVAGWSAYCAAKAALNMFNQVLAAEEPEITAVAFRPGVVDTEMQAVIRRKGAQGMGPGEHSRFVQYHEQGELLPPERPGLALAVLACHAPAGWSSRFVSWNDTEVESLVAKYQSVNHG